VAGRGIAFEDGVADACLTQAVGQGETTDARTGDQDV
jgi:hypothetical protein